MYFLRQRRYLIWRHIIKAICQLKKVFPRKGADLVEQFKVRAAPRLKLFPVFFSMRFKS
jgi:hypothetical protein